MAMEKQELEEQSSEMEGHGAGGAGMKKNKYRAWDKTENRMARNVEELKFNSKGLYAVVLNHMGFEFKRRTMDVELMQYTGLKDKNGKEIYEGDIILDDSISFVDFGVYFERSKFSVKYNQATCGFMRFNEEHKTFSGNIGLFSKENLEIIGNIHEGEVHP